MTRNDNVTFGGTKGEASGERVDGEASQDGEKRKPMYVFTPVDRYGDNKEEIEPLQDLGMTVSGTHAGFISGFCLRGGKHQVPKF